MKILAVLLSFFTFGTSTAYAEFKNVSVKEARALIAENSGNPDFVILDIRTPNEFNARHIPNAINIDFYARDFKAKLNELDKDKTYLVYCRSANRSGQAIPTFKELGFKNVYHMLGGISKW
jgi:rhodanese-related sulfurtransferase